MCSNAPGAFVPSEQDVFRVRTVPRPCNTGTGLQLDASFPRSFRSDRVEANFAESWMITAVRENCARSKRTAAWFCRTEKTRHTLRGYRAEGQGSIRRRIGDSRIDRGRTVTGGDGLTPALCARDRHHPRSVVVSAARVMSSCLSPVVSTRPIAVAPTSPTTRHAAGSLQQLRGRDSHTAVTAWALRNLGRSCAEDTVHRFSRPNARSPPRLAGRIVTTGQA